jgi:hypothetical protein
VAVFACSEKCEPIPWQLDERDPAGELALDQGPEPNLDQPPGVLDDNDILLWMASDLGRRTPVRSLPSWADCVIQITARGRSFSGTVYVVGGEQPAPRSPKSYVEYDPERDVITGARVETGFAGPTPTYFALRPAPGKTPVNLLDRLKVRAYARFLGIIPLRRDEDDLVTQMVSWRAGPIRVVRRQRQWIRLGWGLRTPIFRTDTLFYRDYSEIPVSLKLNFPPTYFFRAIEIQGVLDFRDLRGWRLLAAGLPSPLEIGSITWRERDRLNRLSGDWFALSSKAVTLVQTLSVSPSLASVSRRLVYRESRRGPEPESVPGEMPGVGYRLVDWGDVDRGHHWFVSASYALAPSADVGAFLAERRDDVALRARVVKGDARSTSPKTE